MSWYDVISPLYDFGATGSGKVRRVAVTELRVKAGDAVLDIACGTGLNFPFIEAGIIERWLRQAVESVENGADPEEKMRQLAGEVNERIRLNLERRPRLQERFERRTGRPYTADWWRHYSQV